MPGPVPEHIVARELERAQAIGAILSWSGPHDETGRRRYHVHTADGTHNDWSVSHALAFAAGVLAAAEALEGRVPA